MITRRTAFSIKYLFEMSLDILYLYGSFSGMAKKYVALHLGNYSDDELSTAKNSQERVKSKGLIFSYSSFQLKFCTVCEKRLSTAWFTYSLLEIKQRFHIPGAISSNIDEALSDYHTQIRDGFYVFWGSHKCQVSCKFIQGRFFSLDLTKGTFICLEL